MYCRPQIIALSSFQLPYTPQDIWCHIWATPLLEGIVVWESCAVTFTSSGHNVCKFSVQLSKMWWTNAHDHLWEEEIRWNHLYPGFRWHCLRPQRCKEISVCYKSALLLSYACRYMNCKPSAPSYSHILSLCGYWCKQKWLFDKLGMCPHKVEKCCCLIQSVPWELRVCYISKTKNGQQFAFSGARE